jgi:hypothetical protein
MTIADLTLFKSPLEGNGKEQFRDFCEKHNLDFDDLNPRLSTWFETFPKMIHISIADRQTYFSWWDWIFLCPTE